MNTKTTTFYAESVSFDESERERLIKRAKGWKAFGISGWLVAILGIVTAASFIQMHEFIPVVAVVDKITGDRVVTVGKPRVNMADPANEKMMMADLIRYTKAREGFTRGEAESNYITVTVMSSPSVAGDFDAEYRPERNPTALINRLSPKDQIKLENISVSFLPSDSPKMRVAQVRYDLEKRIGTNDPTTQRYISTYTYTYDPSAIPTSTEGIAANFNGFQILNRRKDKETEETRIAPVNVAPQAGVFQSVPQPAQPVIAAPTAPIQQGVK